VLTLWKRHQPAQTPAVDAALEAARTELTALESGEVRSQASATIEVRWQGRLEVFLEQHPQARSEWNELLALLGSQATDRSPGQLNQEIRAGRDAYVAGRDQTINRAPEA
jgi:hypothetical protein